MNRNKVRFISGDTECVAWHYPGSNGVCVIMAAGTGITKEPGTDLFAKRFNDDGFTVLAFDFRHLGESGGQPRQVVRIGEQVADWEAAIGFAASLPEVDPSRLAIWGFSLAGGEVFEVAARSSNLAAAIAQTPFADGPAVAPNAIRHATLVAMLRLISRGILDALGGIVGREPILVPLVGPSGTIAALSTPDAVEDSDRALNPDNMYPDWQQTIAARSTLRPGFYRPGHDASRVRCPLLVLVATDDQSVLAEPGIRAANQVPHGEVVRVPGGHYAPFLDEHEQTIKAELSFLRRHLLDDPQASRLSDPGHDAVSTS
ncbi:alpha/beta hydrolase [Nocardia sp. 2YAB30]|uniref:alpha/beta hydrolase n=1 Tax=unclassified Nocardia TaxID=2637762 RepID=UPI003F9B1BDF